MSEWRERLRAVALDNLSTHPDRLVRAGLARLSEIERADLLRFAIAEQIEAAQREAIRQREIAANLAEMSRRSHEAERQEAANQEMYGLWHRECSPLTEELRDGHLIYREPETPTLRAWMDSPAGAEWVARIVRSGESLARWKAARDARERRIADAARREAYMKWTTDLLASKFALGDGTYVTWGEATADHHEARIALLERNVLGNLDTLKRHEAALLALAESDAPCLAAINAERVERAA